MSKLLKNNKGLAGPEILSGLLSIGKSLGSRTAEPIIILPDSQFLTF